MRYPFAPKKFKPQPASHIDLGSLCKITEDSAGRTDHQRLQLAGTQDCFSERSRDGASFCSALLDIRFFEGVLGLA